MAARARPRAGPRPASPGHRPGGAAAALALALALAGPAAGQSEGEGPPPAASAADGAQAPTAPRQLGYGVSIGWGAGFAARDRQTGRDVANLQMLSFQPQVRVPITRLGDATRWFHGDLDATFDVLLLLDVTPSIGPGGGLNAGLRYRVLPERRLQPFVEAAIGLGGIDFDLVSQADGFAFFIRAAAGARWRLQDRLHLAGSLRWQHVSNAQTSLPNAGIDTLGLQVGLEVR